MAAHRTRRRGNWPVSRVLRPSSRCCSPYRLPGRAPRPKVLKANGSWRSFKISAAGSYQAFRFDVFAGCRYRLTAQPGSLARPIMEIAPVGDAIAQHRIDAGQSGVDAVHEWDAQRDMNMAVRVMGFSAQVGRAKIKFETIGPAGEKSKPHFRFLEPDATSPKVGELLLRESNEWDLFVKPGVPYEVSTTKGSAGSVRLRVLLGGKQVLGDSNAWKQAWMKFPPVRFRVPKPAEIDDEGNVIPLSQRKLGRVQLEVTGVWSSGGTYGVRLNELPADAAVVPTELEPMPKIERALVPGKPATFRLDAGDMAVLWVPPSVPDLGAQQPVQAIIRDRWIDAEKNGYGDVARGRAPGYGNFQSFRPFQPGIYRFGHGRGVPGGDQARIELYALADLGEAPVHMGTASDPTVRSRCTSKWEVVGLGIVVPNMTYVFVGIGAPLQGMAMRVRTLEGKTVGSRPTSGYALGQVSGMGPSMRFKVKKPQVVRMEVRGSKRIISAMLRQLQEDGR